MLSTQKSLQCICIRQDDGLEDDEPTWTVSRDEMSEVGVFEASAVLHRTPRETEALDLAKAVGLKQGLPVYFTSDEEGPMLLQMPGGEPF
jgi:hypothetical protein